MRTRRATRSLRPKTADRTGCGFLRLTAPNLCAVGAPFESIAFPDIASAIRAARRRCEAVAAGRVVRTFAAESVRLLRVMRRVLAGFLHKSCRNFCASESGVRADSVKVSRSAAAVAVRPVYLPAGGGADRAGVEVALVFVSGKTGTTGSSQVRLLCGRVTQNTLQRLSVAHRYCEVKPQRNPAVAPTHAG